MIIMLRQCRRVVYGEDTPSPGEGYAVLSRDIGYQHHHRAIGESYVGSRSPGGRRGVGI